jgi:hypothetical protein
VRGWVRSARSARGNPAVSMTASGLRTIGDGGLGFASVVSLPP